MSNLNSYFEKKGASYRHPLLSFLDNFLEKHPVDLAQIQVTRPKDVLGFKSAKIYLHLVIDGKKLPPTEYSWDDDLNEALLAKGIKSISAVDEKTRFALGLRFAFKRAEFRFGDGFFNAVLLVVVKESGFAENAEVEEVLKDVHTNLPYMGGNGYMDCRDMIDKAISGRAEELESLKYSRDEAKEILVGAMALYLDERFTVTDRRRLGLT